MKRSKSKIKGIIEAKKNSYGKIPTNTLSGGSRKYDSKDILQYRVWSHPIGKDVVLHTFKTYDQALKKSKELQKRKNLAYVEKPIGVIKNKSESEHREIVLLNLPKNDGMKI